MELTISLPTIESVNLEDVKLDFIDLLKFDIYYCIKLFKKFGILDKNPICCNESMSLSKKSQLTDGYEHFCTVCRKHKSIRHGSFFERSHLKLYDILKIIYCYAQDITSQQFFCNEMGLSSKTIVDWKCFIRDIYTNHVIENSSKVGGEGIIVQIDESLICKRKYNVGRILSNQDQWIVGGIDDNGNVFMEITTVRNEATLTQIISRWVEPGSIIWSDSWRGYRRLDEKGFYHETVNHSQEFVSSEGVHTNRIEATWGACKRKISSIRNKKPNLIPSYLHEYIFKKKFKNNVFPQTIREICRIYKF